MRDYTFGSPYPDARLAGWVIDRLVGADSLGRNYEISGPEGACFLTEIETRDEAAARSLVSQCFALKQSGAVTDYSLREEFGGYVLAVRHNRPEQLEGMLVLPRAAAPMPIPTPMPKPTPAPAPVPAAAPAPREPAYAAAPVYQPAQQAYQPYTAPQPPPQPQPAYQGYAPYPGYGQAYSQPQKPKKKGHALLFSLLGVLLLLVGAAVAGYFFAIVRDVTLPSTPLTVFVGKPVPAGAVLTPEDPLIEKLSWESSDAKIAVVNADGLIEGLAPGSVTLTAKSLLVQKTMTVQVLLPVTGIDLPTPEVSLTPGETYWIYYDIVPKNATPQVIDYRASNTGVASVDGEGRVTAHASGQSIITIDIDGVTTRVTVNVTQPVTEIRLAADKFVLELGKTAKIDYVLLPANADAAQVTFVSSDPSVVRVDDYGNITATSEGAEGRTRHAAVRVEAGEVWVSIDVEVRDSYYISASPSKETLNDTTVTPRVFANPVENCIGFRLTYSYGEGEDSFNIPEAQDFRVYIYTQGIGWEHIGHISVQPEIEEIKDITFSARTVTMVAVVPDKWDVEEGSYDSSTFVDEVQTR